MCGQSAPSDFERIVERLASAGSLLVLTHARPDGDGIGSMIALAGAAEAVGKAARLLVPDAPPARYAFLCAGRQVAGADRFAPLADAADVIVVVDTCALGQLDGLGEALESRREKVVVIDHHATGDEVGSVQWVDPSAAAAGVMVGELIDALGWPVDAAVAEALVTAVTTDTGWMRFANTDARALRQLAGWIEAGVRPDALYRKIYQNDRPQRLALLARMLASLELHADGRLAVMTIRRGDFDAVGAAEEETENLVSEAFRLGSVDTAMLLVEQADCVRVSLRSRDDVDVAALARRFGGGGHARAAGLRLEEDLDRLRRRLIEACTAELKANKWDK